DHARRDRRRYIVHSNLLRGLENTRNETAENRKRMASSARSQGSKQEVFDELRGRAQFGGGRTERLFARTIEPARDEQCTALQIHQTDSTSDDDGRQQEPWRDGTQCALCHAGSEEREASQFEQSESRSVTGRNQRTKGCGADDYLKRMAGRHGRAGHRRKDCILPGYLGS